MKFAAVALFAGLAAAETAELFNFSYNSVNGYPIVEFSIKGGNVDALHCLAKNYVVGGTYSCDDPSWTFTINEEQGRSIDVIQELNGVTKEAHFKVRMNGPIPTVLDQIGTSTAELEVVN